MFAPCLIKINQMETIELSPRTFNKLYKLALDGNTDKACSLLNRKKYPTPLCCSSTHYKLEIKDYKTLVISWKEGEFIYEKTNNREIWWLFNILSIFLFFFVTILVVLVDKWTGGQGYGDLGVYIIVLTWLFLVKKLENIYLKFFTNNKTAF